MVQVRKLVLAIAAASALSSGMAQALQLGEMTLKSKLNQPLSPAAIREADDENYTYIVTPVRTAH